MSGAESLGILVIGTGHLGRYHAQKYTRTEGAALIAVCDRNAESASKVGSEFGVPWVRHPEELSPELRKKIKGVVIAASTPAHYELARWSLLSGYHVFVEKPLTIEIEHGRDLVDMAHQKGLKLQVGHVERFNPALQAAQSKLIRPLFIECHRLAPFKIRSMEVSVVLDLMIHDLDVIMSLVKSPIRSVSAVGARVFTKEIDIASARIEFESRAVANVTSSRVSLNTQRKFRVFQPKQYLSIDFGSGDVQMITKTGELQIVEGVEPELPIEIESWNLEKGDALLAEAQSFVDSIRYDRPCLVSGEDGLNALKLATTISSLIEERQGQVGALDL